MRAAGATHRTIDRRARMPPHSGARAPDRPLARRDTLARFDAFCCADEKGV